MELTELCMTTLLTTAEYTLRFSTLQLSLPCLLRPSLIVHHCCYLGEVCRRHFVSTAAGSRLLLFQTHHATTIIFFSSEVMIVIVVCQNQGFRKANSLRLEEWCTYTVHCLHEYRDGRFWAELSSGMCDVCVCVWGGGTMSEKKICVCVCVRARTCVRARLCSHLCNSPSFFKLWFWRWWWSLLFVVWEFQSCAGYCGKVG
jgi:hypothetical protein